MMKKWLSFLLACLLPLSGALAADPNLPDLTGGPLPQLEKVTFEAVAYDMPSEGRFNYAADKANFSEDGMSYHDATLDVKLHKFHIYNADVTVAFVQIADPDQLRTQQAKKYPSKATARIDTIAKPVKSVFAVNGDWFTYRNDGIVYRNGELLRSREMPEDEGLAIDINGNFHIVSPMTEAEYAKLEVPVMQSFAFGPALVVDGEVPEIIRKLTYRQRMAIGQVDELCYVFVAADGTNEDDGEGLSVPELAQLMHDLGAKIAYNLDGGQSTSMLMGNTKVNGHPKTMRAIGDIIYFTTAVPDEE